MNRPRYVVRRQEYVIPRRATFCRWHVIDSKASEFAPPAGDFAARDVARKTARRLNGPALSIVAAE